MQIIHNGIVTDDLYTWAGYQLQDLLAVELCQVRNKYGLPYTLRKVILKMVDNYLETLLADRHQPVFGTRDWKLVDRINTAIAELEEL